ncbi:hypothetical protein BGZ72_001477 [Mortierella alpina]|nr:hypothetical protein BGZ72_001477 [Mortierella alpina]
MLATFLSPGANGLPMALEKRYGLDNLVHDVEGLVTHPQSLITGTHNHVLHGKLIDCGYASIFDSRTTEELQKAYNDHDCDNKLGLFQLLGNAQDIIAVLPDQNGVNHSFLQFDLLGTQEHPTTPAKDHQK